MEGDELYSLRSFFYLGNYSAALEEAQELDESTPRDVFMYRALINKGEYKSVLNLISKISNDSEPEIMACKFLAMLNSPGGIVNAEKILGEVNMLEHTPLVAIIAAEMQLKLKQPIEALKVLQTGMREGGVPVSYEDEILALKAEIFIAMNRFDLAQAEAKKLEELAEDSVLQQITTLKVNLCSKIFQNSSKGTEKSETELLSEELVERSGESAECCVMAGAMKLKCGKVKEALKILQKVLKKEAVKPQNQGEWDWGGISGLKRAHEELVANLMVCAVRMGRDKVMKECARKLKEMRLERLQSGKNVKVNEEKLYAGDIGKRIQVGLMSSA